MKVNTIFFVCTLLNFTSFSQVWNDVNGGLIDTSGTISLSLQNIWSYNNELYISGSFDHIGNNNLYTGTIARWDGFQWNPASNKGGANGYINSSVIINNELYVVGSFTNIDSVSNTKYFAKWDGAQWDSVHNLKPNTDRVYAIEYLNQIYIGGQFTTVTNLWMSPTTVNNITAWNGSSWKSVAGGVTGGFISKVRCMAVYNGELYVGGDFTYAGGIPANYIARWNGVQWDSLGSGLDYLPNTMLVDTVSNILYVGGGFTKAGNISVNNLTKWDGSSWSDVGGGIRSKLSGVMAMAIYHNNLFIAGQSATGSYNDTIIEYFDGQSWYKINSPNNTVAALYVYNDELYAGGYFDKVDTGGGELTVNYIARLWMPPSGIKEKETEVIQPLKIYPNPAGRSFTLEIHHSSFKIQNLSLKIHDVKGKLIYQSKIQNPKSEISSKGWEKGIYFVNLMEEGKTIAKEKMVVK